MVNANWKFSQHLPNLMIFFFFSSVLEKKVMQIWNDKKIVNDKSFQFGKTIPLKSIDKTKLSSNYDLLIWHIFLAACALTQRPHLRFFFFPHTIWVKCGSKSDMYRIWYLVSWYNLNVFVVKHIIKRKKWRTSSCELLISMCVFLPVELWWAAVPLQDYHSLEPDRGPSLPSSPITYRQKNHVHTHTDKWVISATCQ